MIQACAMTIAFLVLSAIYLSQVGICTRLLYKLYHRVQRESPHTTFLCVIFVQAIGRAMYFLISPFYFSEATCQHDVDECKGQGILGTIFAPLFLTAFSVLLSTFSRIYHRVLNSTSEHQRWNKYLIVMLVTMNVSLYTAFLYQCILIWMGRSCEAPLRWAIVLLAVWTFLTVLPSLRVGLCLSAA
jgi:hypothetical protein